jgi:hypothetical protein
MINENSLSNKPERAGERSKQEAQQELGEKFGLRKTSDFQAALQRGEIELAQQWLDYIVEHREKFPQYADTWDSWLSDRQKDIEIYQRLKDDGLLEKMEPRTKEQAQAELQEKFGFCDTKGFRRALEQGELAKAEEWLDYIVANKLRFPQYLATWDNWLRDRRQELAEAKK